MKLLSRVSRETPLHRSIRRLTKHYFRVTKGLFPKSLVCFYSRNKSTVSQILSASRFQVLDSLNLIINFNPINQ